MDRETGRLAKVETEPAPIVERVLGLDLGKSLDYTALCGLEVSGNRDAPKERMHHCRHLQRFKLGTNYPQIVDTVRELCSREPLRSHKPWLVVDGTGVGNAVVDLFRQKPINARLRPVVIHGGDTVVHERGIYRVPKRELVGCVQVALQTGRLKIAGELPDVGILTQELQNFQVSISETAHDSYEARAGKHDDYVLAVAIALWFAQNRIRYVRMINTDGWGPLRPYGEG
jgi:hypothetical protein